MNKHKLHGMVFALVMLTLALIFIFGLLLVQVVLEEHK